MKNKEGVPEVGVLRIRILWNGGELGCGVD